MRRKILCTLAIGIIVIGSGCLSVQPQSSNPNKIVLAIQPTTNVDAIQDKADELEAFLESRTGYDVEIHIPLLNSGVVESLRMGFADAAMLSAWPSLLANKVGGAEIVLAEKREVIIGAERQVQPYYFSYYVVPKDSPIQTLADLRGKTVAFTSTTSTSGYVFPVAKLIDEGLLATPATGEVDPKAFFGSVVFAGGYGQGWEALKRGQVDATVIAGDVSASLYYDVLNNTRIIATQGPVPSHGVVVAKGISAEKKEALVSAFLELKGEHQPLMRNLVSAIFVEFQDTTTANHTAALEDALDKAGLKFQEKLG